MICNKCFAVIDLNDDSVYEDQSRDFVICGCCKHSQIIDPAGFNHDLFFIKKRPTQEIPNKNIGRPVVTDGEYKKLQVKASQIYYIVRDLLAVEKKTGVLVGFCPTSDGNMINLKLSWLMGTEYHRRIFTLLSRTTVNPTPSAVAAFTFEIEKDSPEWIRKVLTSFQKDTCIDRPAPNKFHVKGYAILPPRVAVSRILLDLDKIMACLEAKAAKKEGVIG